MKRTHAGTVIKELDVNALNILPAGIIYQVEFIGSADYDVCEDGVHTVTQVLNQYLVEYREVTE